MRFSENCKLNFHSHLTKDSLLSFSYELLRKLLVLPCFREIFLLLSEKFESCHFLRYISTTCLRLLHSSIICLCNNSHPTI